ncbi:recombination protein NinG [Chitinophaga sp. Hz27]|uniref:recombination protein NinG n=1 Tax=Chitinophaga sp. Hz27 TaxID=3347169 RepID=UPI0035D868EE
MNITPDQYKKYAAKSLPALIRIAEKHFNAFIRKRDSDGDYFTCISCQEVKPVSLMHAGHFLSAGHNTNVRFHTDNVHGQCSRCNTHEHGNLIEYNDNLIAKIGAERVQHLKDIARLPHKWDRAELIAIIVKYK